MTEQDEQKQQELLVENFSRLANQLYDGGVPGINIFAAEVIHANFTPDELINAHKWENAQTARRKMALIKPIFTVAVGEAILAAGTENMHGNDVTAVMRDVYSVLMRELIEKLQNKK